MIINLVVKKILDNQKNLYFADSFLLGLIQRLVFSGILSVSFVFGASALTDNQPLDEEKAPVHSTVSNSTSLDPNQADFARASDVIPAATNAILPKLEEFIASLDEWAPLVFFLTCFVATLCFVPMTVFALISGSLFGTQLGILLLSGAVSLAALTAFLVGRGLRNRFSITQYFKLEEKKWFIRAQHVLTHNGYKSIFIVRNIPHPFMLFSYAAGNLHGIKLLEFGLTTFVVLSIRGFALVFIGEHLTQGPQALILPLLALGLLIVGSLYIRSKTTKMKPVQVFTEEISS